MATPYIRYWRKSKGLTQQELADAAGIERTHLSVAERAPSNPSAEYLSKISSALGVTVDQLLNGPTATPAALDPVQTEDTGRLDELALKLTDSIIASRGGNVDAAEAVEIFKNIRRHLATQ